MRKKFMILICAGIFLFCFKSVLIKHIVMQVTSSILGTEVKIKSFSFGVFNRSIKIKGLKVYDPKGFAKDVLLNIPNIKLDFYFLSLLKGKIHLREAVFHLKELSVVENIDGKLNVDSLDIIRKESKKTEQEKKSKDNESNLNFQIDVLKLKVEKVVKKTYKSNSKYPNIKVKNINFEKKYKNIKSLSRLMILILSETMRKAVIKSAMIYGLSSVAGAALITTFMPVGLAVNFLKSENISEKFNIAKSKVWDTVLTYIEERGTLIEKDQEQGLVKAKINSYDVAFIISVKEKKITQLTVSAKKLLLKKNDIANAILYEISKVLEED